MQPFLEDKLVLTSSKKVVFVYTDWGYPEPECPRTPARVPHASKHHLRGACRRNFWSGIFDPRENGATLNRIPVVLYRKVSLKISKSAISGCHSSSTSPGIPPAHPGSMTPPNATLAAVEHFEPFLNVSYFAHNSLYGGKYRNRSSGL